MLSGFSKKGASNGSISVDLSVAATADLRNQRDLVSADDTGMALQQRVIWGLWCNGTEKLVKTDCCAKKACKSFQKTQKMHTSGKQRG
jgi:hypothetical protein